MPDAQGSKAPTPVTPDWLPPRSRISRAAANQPRGTAHTHRPALRAQRHTAFHQRTLSTSRFLLVRGLQACALHCERDWRKFFCQGVVTKAYQRSFDDLYTKVRDSLMVVVVVVVLVGFMER